MTVEIRVRERKKGGPKYGPFESIEEMHRAIPKEDLDRNSSWQTVVKFNRGYADNHESGGTCVIDWRGDLRDLFSAAETVIKAHEKAHE